MEIRNLECITIYNSTLLYTKVEGIVLLYKNIFFMISVKILSLCFLGLFMGCKSFKKETSQEKIIAMEKEGMTKVNHTSPGNCPDDGTCMWSVMSDTNLILKEDTIGARYPVFEKEVGTHTIKFEYDRTVEKGLADGGYKEVIYFHIPATTTSITLKDEALQDVGLTYGRLCFCRGATGHYPITKGALKLDKTTEGYKVTLSFENGKVPQLINNLEETIAMDKNTQVDR